MRSLHRQSRVTEEHRGKLRWVSSVIGVATPRVPRAGVTGIFPLNSKLSRTFQTDPTSDPHVGFLSSYLKASTAIARSGE